jgi:hypothetical protein
MHNNVVLKDRRSVANDQNEINGDCDGVTNAVLWYVPCLGRCEWYGECSMLYCDTPIAIRT